MLKEVFHQENHFKLLFSGVMSTVESFQYPFYAKLNKVSGEHIASELKLHLKLSSEFFRERFRHNFGRTQYPEHTFYCIFFHVVKQQQKTIL